MPEPCDRCNSPLIEIDHYGARLTGFKIVASLVPKQMEIESSIQPFAVIPEHAKSIDAWEKAFSPVGRHGPDMEC